MKLGHFSKVLLIIFVFSAVFSIPNLASAQPEVFATVTGSDPAGGGTGGFDAKKQTPSNDPDGIGEMVIYGFGNVVTWSLLKGGAIYLGITGYLFDKALDFTVRDVRTTYSLFEKSVNDIWIIIRDFGNIVIVFSMLYLAIKTILQGNGWADKKALTGILLAALLINFSLFFTKLVFDGSNMAANAIYSSINIGESGDQGSGFSTAIVGMFNYQDLVNKSYNLSEDFISRMSSQIITAFFGFILMFVTGSIFWASILLLIIRFIFFIGLMMTSALALVGYFIPFLRDKANIWWTQLWKQSLVLPAFMMCLYVSFLVIQMALFNINIKSIKWTELLSGNVNTIGESFSSAFTAVFFIILSLIMLIFSVILPGFIGSAGANILKTGTAKIAGKGSAMMGQYTIGYAGRKIANYEPLKSASKLTLDQGVGAAIKGAAARATRNVGDYVGNKRTFDFRNIKVAGKTVGEKYGLGKGVKSYQDVLKEKKAKLTEKEKDYRKKFDLDELTDAEKKELENLTADKEAFMEEKKRLAKDLNERKKKVEEDLLRTKPGATKEEIRVAQDSDAEVTKIRTKSAEIDKEIKDVKINIVKKTQKGFKTVEKILNSPLNRMVNAIKLDFMANKALSDMVKDKEKEWEKLAKQGNSSVDKILKEINKDKK